MAAPSPAAPGPPAKKSGPGCLVLTIALVAVIAVGLTVGTLLSSGGDDGSEQSVTLADGTLDGTSWRVDATRDEQDAICVFLYTDADEPLTGACSLTPQDATFGDQTVVFGKAASDAGSVSVALSNGEVAEIPTQAADGISGRFYVTVVDGDVDADGFAT
jgi:hypothetical protein